MDAIINLEKVRKDTIGCETVIHLNNAGASLMPHTVAVAIREYITDEEKNGGYETAQQKNKELDQFYLEASRLLNCNEGNVAFTTSATDSFNRALSSIAFKQKDVILTTTNDYPSNFIAFLSLQKRFGVSTVLVANTDTGEMDLQDLERKIKKHSPKLVAVTHVPTSSGLVQPVEQIGNIVKNHECLYLIDACQSLGQMHFDVQETKADFVTGTFRKFLRGPRGAGLLYVSDKALNSGLELMLPDLRGAEWTSAGEYRFRNDAKRFEHWEMAFALMMGSKEALRYMLDLGMDNIQKRNESLASQLRGKLSKIPHIQLLDRGSRQCNIITFILPFFSETAAKAYFKEKKINIHTTPKTSALIDFKEKQVEWAVRVSPHYYNTEQELDTFVAAVWEAKK